MIKVLLGEIVVFIKFKSKDILVNSLKRDDDKIKSIEGLFG